MRSLIRSLMYDRHSQQLQHRKRSLRASLSRSASMLHVPSALTLTLRCFVFVSVFFLVQAKGASLIRMLHAAIGDIAFKKGLQSYLRQFSYQNTKTEDLWAAFAHSSGQDVASMMSHWVQRIGYPVLSASERPGQKLCLCQERFLATYDPAAQSKLHETTWVVPVDVASWKKVDLAAGKNDNPHIMKALFNTPEAEFPALGLEAASVLKINPGQSGFYRVAYSPALFSTLAESIQLLPPVERLGVLRDTFALGSSGRTSITQSLELLRHFTGETNYAVVSALAGNLAALASLHQEKPYYPQIQVLVREVFATNFARLGWESTLVDGAVKATPQEEQQAMLFRSLVISMLGPVAGLPDIVAEALRRFRAFVAAPLANPIPADLRGSVYSIVAKQGSTEDYAALRRMYLESELQEEKNRLLGVMGMIDSSASASVDESKTAADLARIRSVLGLVLAADSPVRPGNLGTLMSGVGSSAMGRQEAWKWFTENFDVIAEKFSKVSARHRHQAHALQHKKKQRAPIPACRLSLLPLLSVAFCFCCSPGSKFHHQWHTERHARRRQFAGVGRAVRGVLPCAPHSAGGQNHQTAQRGDHNQGG